MTNQRYATPAIVAAAFHAVLLFGVKPDGPEIVISKPEPVKKTWIEVPPELYTPPTPDPAAEKVADVKPLLGDPPPLATPEPASLPRGNFEMPAEDVRPRFVTHLTTKLLPVYGDPDGSPDGNPDWRNRPMTLDHTQLDRMPRAKVQIAPDYPFELKRTGVEGSVLIEFEVDTTGQVISARVLRSDRREFEAPTLRAVLKWRFEPGRRNGQAVPFRMQIPVDFHLNQN